MGMFLVPKVRERPCKSLATAQCGIFGIDCCLYLVGIHPMPVAAVDGANANARGTVVRCKNSIMSCFGFLFASLMWTLSVAPLVLSVVSLAS